MKRIEKGFIHVNNQELFLLRIRPPHNIDNVGTILIPPLIGGNALTQYQYCRMMNRYGYELISFDYRGHGKSGGKFDVTSALHDTRSIAKIIHEKYGKEKIFGIAHCFGAIPLLYAVNKHPELFKKVVLVNPVPGLQYPTTPYEALKRYFHMENNFRIRNPFHVKKLLLDTIERSLPDVDTSHNHFGLLNYENVKKFSVIREYLFLSPLKDVFIHTTPIMLIYGQADHTLQLHDNKIEMSYQYSFKRIIKNLFLKPIPNASHYFEEFYGLGSQLAESFFNES